MFNVHRKCLFIVCASLCVYKCALYILRYTYNKLIHFSRNTYIYYILYRYVLYVRVYCVLYKILRILYIYVLYCILYIVYVFCILRMYTIYLRFYKTHTDRYLFGGSSLNLDRSLPDIKKIHP